MRALLAFITAVRFLFIFFHGRGRDKAEYTGESADSANRSCQLIRASQWEDGWPFIRGAVSGWQRVQVEDGFVRDLVDI